MPDRRLWRGASVARVTRLARLAPAILVAVALVSCQGGAVSRETVAKEEDRLLAPYGKGLQIVADRVEVDVSANFFSQTVDAAALARDPEAVRSGLAHLGLPATSPELHERRVVKSDQNVEYVFHNVRGGMQMPLRLSVGGAVILALRSAVVRVLGNGAPLTLTTVASGQVTVRQGDVRQDLNEIRIEDGAIHRQ